MFKQEYHNRDLIDLAMVGLDKKTLHEAITSLSENKGRLEVCMDALKIDEIPKAQLWQRIRNLGK